MNIRRFASTLAVASLISGSGIALDLASSFTPLAQQAQAAYYQNCSFTGKIAFSPTNVRSQTNTGSSIVKKFWTVGEQVRFSSFDYGQSVADAWTGRPDNMWFKLADGSGYIASAVVNGYPPTSPCSSTPPSPTGLQSNPTESNPLTGFINPLNGQKDLSLGFHWSDAYGQKYARDFSSVSTGTSVYAMRSGTVIGWKDTTADKATGQAINDGAQGTTANYLLIKLDDSDGTDDNYRLMYLHLKQNSIPAPLKQAGARVQSGQKIGEVGYNGWSDGVHLHVEVNQSTSSNIWSRTTKPFRS